MELRRDIWDRWHSSPTYLAGGHCALPVPVVFWCQLSTVGSRAFNVGPRSWNLLPEEITSAQSLSMFRQRLKTFLFGKSYPDVILWSWNVVVCWLFWLLFSISCLCVFFISLNLEVALLFRRFLIDWLIDWLKVDLLQSNLRRGQSVGAGGSLCREC